MNIFNPFLRQTASVRTNLKPEEVLDKVRYELSDENMDGSIQGNKYYLKQNKGDYSIEGNLTDSYINLQANTSGHLKLLIRIISSLTLLSFFLGVLFAALTSLDNSALTFIIVGLSGFFLTTVITNYQLSNLLQRHKNVIKCWEHETPANMS